MNIIPALEMKGLRAPEIYYIGNQVVVKYEFRSDEGAVSNPLMVWNPPRTLGDNGRAACPPCLPLLRKAGIYYMSGLSFSMSAAQTSCMQVESTKFGLKRNRSPQYPKEKALRYWKRLSNL